LQYPIALFGVLRAGMAWSTRTRVYGTRIGTSAQGLRRKCIVIVETLRTVLQQVLPRTDLRRLVTRIGDLLGMPRGSW